MFEPLNAVGMVFVLDEGSAFNAPLETIWKYNQSEREHNHPSMKNLKVGQEGGSFIFDFDSAEPDAKSVKTKIKVTFYPPSGFAVEELEGRFAGSKYFNYYTPKGKRTGITVVGHWSSATIPEAKLKKAALDHLAVVFKEDSGNLKNFK
jgi:hypothetical protein